VVQDETLLSFDKQLRTQLDFQKFFLRGGLTATAVEIAVVHEVEFENHYHRSEVRHNCIDKHVRQDLDAHQSLPERVYVLWVIIPQIGNLSLKEVIRAED